jgi:hypothetical protein
MFSDLAYIEGLNILGDHHSTAGIVDGIPYRRHVKQNTQERTPASTRYLSSERVQGRKRKGTDSEEVFMSIKSVVEQRGVVFDTSGPNKHVHKSEVSIRVLKERVRSVIYSLPYVLPRVWCSSLRVSTRCCAKTRVDPTPPREIFTNMKISLKREIRIDFGGLVLVENVPNKKTSMEPRARYQCHDIISSRYHFFLLDTEEFVVRTNWAENVPLTEALIDRINEIAARDEQLMVHNAEKGLGRKLAKLSYKPTP